MTEKKDLSNKVKKPVQRPVRTGRVKGFAPRALTAKQRRAQKRRRLVKKLREVLGLAAALALIVLGFDRFVLPMVQPAPPSDLMGPCKVVSVADGDTFSAEVEGETRSIRLIGVDTPESVHPDASKNTPQGKIASAYTKDLLRGRNVWLETDAEQTDKYGRLLCYVYLDSEGKIMVQELLLKDGMASVMTVPPNVKYEDRFLELQKKAREEKAGFWAEDVF